MLGKYLSEFALSKSYFEAKSIKKATTLFDKYGFISLLFAWLPIIGDPITFVAGLFKYNWLKFLVLVTISKFLRYAFLLYMFEFASK
ncbi:MAG: VTT domain-containing protein [Sulfurospirillaceae bacterium]|nr:VTT domain-containing protein [Sulfurospirillaceae bacterium]